MAQKTENPDETYEDPYLKILTSTVADLPADNDLRASIKKLATPDTSDAGIEELQIKDLALEAMRRLQRDGEPKEAYAVRLGLGLNALKYVLSAKKRHLGLDPFKHLLDHYSGGKGEPVDQLKIVFEQAAELDLQPEPKKYKKPKSPAGKEDISAYVRRIFDARDEAELDKKIVDSLGLFPEQPKLVRVDPDSSEKVPYAEKALADYKRFLTADNSMSADYRASVEKRRKEIAERDEDEVRRN